MTRLEKLVTMVVLLVVIFFIGTLITGCATLRLAPTEAQKQAAQIGVDVSSVIDKVGCQPNSETSSTIKAVSGVSQQYIGVPTTAMGNRNDIIAQARLDAKDDVTIGEVAEGVSEVIGFLEPILSPAVLGLLGLSGVGIGTYMSRAKRLANDLQTTEDKRKQLDFVINEIVMGIESFKAGHESDDAGVIDLKGDLETSTTDDSKVLILQKILELAS